MRNLKKILALVLALVMSLSLMATASAADFKDASDINEKYETAIEVLEGLGVFKGYQDGTFQPTGSITRAETAAIIYRIVTGDVKDEQVKIYSDYNLFSDVPSTSWFAGYVNYCANAEYIKGVGGGKFEPNAKVTGYAALAMILRAIGYTANGGFTGPDWEVQTARTGEARKITKNILTGTLGENATRETVAEILFQAILVNMVDHNILNSENGSQGYFELDQSLGYKTFGLEELEGVIVANEFANLYGASVLANDKTDFEVAKDDIRSLDIGTEITDIGMRQLAYIAHSKVLSITDEGLNKVTETGDATDIDTAPKFRSTADMNWVGTGADATQFYVNFGRTGSVTCDQRLEFSVTFQSQLAEDSFDVYAGTNISRIAAADNTDRITNGGGALDTTNDWNVTGAVLNADGTDYVPVNYATTSVTFQKIIRADIDISDTDLAVLYGIFGAADNAAGLGNNLAWHQIDGDVFVGTVSTNPAAREEEDLSNKISYNKFVADYLNPETYDVNWDNSVNGDWVKFIDNDLDGNADYAFLTESWLDEATGTYTSRAGDTITEYYRFNEENSTVRYMDGNTPAVGDVVVCALIDGQILVEPAKSETVTVSNYDWRADKITTDKGEYGQSGIWNWTEMQQLIRNMEDRTEYIVYFDHFGFVRAYELPGDTQYALLTEIYAKNNMTGSVLQQWPMTVELKAGEADMAEYSLNGGYTNLFVARSPWTQVASWVGTARYHNWLQPAIAHLGVTRTGFTPTKGAPNFTDNTWTLWPDWYQFVKEVRPADVAGLQEFNYGPYDRTKVEADYTVDDTYSFTNVAIANINGDAATLTGAAQLRLNNAGQVMAWNDVGNNGTFDGALGELPRYAVDYVQLATGNVAAGQVNYTIHANYTGYTGTNAVVNATHNTEFYIVHDGGVEYFKDYTNMPALNGDNYIYAAYAVARDTSEDSATNPYWVADVIVYEVRTWNDDARTSVALAYFGQSRSTGEVQMIKTLSNVSGGPMVDVVPTNLSWDAQAGHFTGSFTDYGFYQVWNGSDVADGQMTARRITRIPEGTRTYASYGIYAGVVDRVTADAVSGGYIYVRTTDGGREFRMSLAVSNNVYEIQNDTQLGGGNYNEAISLRYNNLATNEVHPGDLIVWQGGARNTTNVCASAYIVDLGVVPDAVIDTESEARYRDTPGFIKTELARINAQQGTPAGGDYIDVNFSYDSATSGFNRPAAFTEQVPKGTEVIYDLTKAPFAIDGWTATGVNVTDADGATIATGATTWAFAGGKLTLDDAMLTDDINIKVNYTKNAISLGRTLTNTGGAALTDAAVTWSVNGQTGTLASMPTSGSPANLKYNDVVTLTWSAAAHTVYTLTALTNATATDAAGTAITTTVGEDVIPAVGGVCTLKLKVTGAATFAIANTAETSVTFAGTTTNGIAATGDWAFKTVDGTAIPNGKVYAGDKFTATPTTTGNWKVTNVYWVGADGVSHNMTEKKNSSGVGTGEYLSDSAIAAAAGTAITVYATTESTVANVKLGSLGVAAATAKYTDGSGVEVAAGAFTTANAEVLPVKKGTNVEITFTNPTPAAYVKAYVNKQPVDLAITGNGSNKITVYNITQDTLLMVSATGTDFPASIS